MMQAITPPRKKARSLGSITNAIVSISPQQLPIFLSDNTNAVTPSTSADVVVLNCFLTWRNYIDSQNTSRSNSSANPLQSIDTLKRILIHRQLIKSPRKGHLHVRQQFERLLESINGPYCSITETMALLPPQEARQLQSCNFQLKEYVNGWCTKFIANVTQFSCMSDTRDVLRVINVSIEEVALSRSREIDQDRLMKKQAEFAEYFKNHVGNADMHVYGQLTVHRKNYIAEDFSMDDHEKNQLANTIYRILSTHPAAIVPLVHSNAPFFLSHLEEMKKVKNTFALNASLVTALSNLPESIQPAHDVVDEVAESNLILHFICYCCRASFLWKNDFVLHMKEHEPATRNSTDDYHEKSFSMIIPTAKSIDCLDAIKLFRQGNDTSPPAVLWSKKTRQNKRLFYIMKDLDDKYEADGHNTFIKDTQHLKASSFVKKVINSK